MVARRDAVAIRSGASAGAEAGSQMNLRKFDLNLLVIFQAIMEQQSVVAAATKIGLSAPAVSHALARLRVMFNDELFRRTARGLEPTERARELYGEVVSGLGHIQNALERQHVFDPATSEQIFTVQITDYVSGTLLPRLAARLRAEAPGVSVHVVPFSTGADSDRIDADVQIRFTPGDQALSHAYSQRLLLDKFVVIMRPDHPAADEEMTPERYATLNHARLSPAAAGTSIVDDALERRGLKRRVVMSVPTWPDIPPIIEGTDLIAIIPRSWLLSDSRIAALVSRPLPLPEVVYSIDLCWDRRKDRNSSQKWFRGLIAKLFA